MTYQEIIAKGESEKGKGTPPADIRTMVNAELNAPSYSFLDASERVKLVNQAFADLGITGENEKYDKQGNLIPEVPPAPTPIP